MRRPEKLLSGILLLGLILRLIRIGGRDIWYDDAFSIFLARQPADRIISGTAADTMPPLYYLLLHGWMQLGQSIAWLRLLNVFLSLLVVFLVYLWISTLFGPGAGLWASLITAVSPLEIYHAQELRMYALLTLSLLGYALFFTRILQRRPLFSKNWTNWVGLVLSGACAMYTHNLAVFTLAVPIIFTAIFRKWGLLLRLAGALAAIGLASLPWLVYIPGQIEKIQTAFWTPRPGLIEIFQMVITFISNLPLPGVLLAIAAVGSIQVILLLLLESRRNRWRDEPAWLLLAFSILPPALLFAASYAMRPIFVPRAAMLSSIALYGLIGRVAACGQKRAVGVALGCLTVALAVAGLPYQYTYNEFPRSPYQTTAAGLKQTAQETDIIIHDNKLSYFPMAVYAPDLKQVFIADPPGSHNDTLAPATQKAMNIYPVPDIEHAAGDSRRIKFVVFQTAIQEYREQGKAHPILTWLDGNYQLAGHQAFNDLEVYEYVR